MLKTFAFFVLDTLVTRASSALTVERMRMYRLLDRPRHVAGSVQIAGRQFQYPDAASCFSAWRYIFDDQCYQFECSSEFPVILDLGANIGLASYFFHQRYPKAKIIAIEPDSNLYGLLRSNLGGIANIEIRRVAILDHDGEADFFGTDDDSGSVFGGQAESRYVEKVPCQKLSTLLAQLEKVDLLKMDIEGAETQAIIDAEKQLNRVENLFVEFHSFRNHPQSLSSLLAVLERCGFRYSLQSESITRSPFLNRRAETPMDSRVNIYAVNARSVSDDQSG